MLFSLLSLNADDADFQTRIQRILFKTITEICSLKLNTEYSFTLYPTTSKYRQNTSCRYC
jgi:hypothetical protein